MGFSININVSVYIYNGGSPVMNSIVLKPLIRDSPKNLFEVYTPSSGSPDFFPEVLHTLGWFLGLKCLGLHTWCLNKNKEIVYTPTINVMVYAHFGGSPKTKF